MTTETLVIYHDACDDGTTAAAIADAALINANFHPANYGEAPPDVKDKLVYILDFAYPPDVTKGMAEDAKAVMVLDHHVSAMKAFKEAFTMETIRLDEKEIRPDRTCYYNDRKLAVLFDMDYSGAGLAWNHFNRASAMPPFVNHIQASDLWKHDDVPGTREFIRWVRSHPHSIESYGALMKSVTGDIYINALKEGAAIDRYFNESVKNHINWSDVRALKLGDANGLVVCGPRVMISEIGHILATECNGFGCVWYPRNGRAYVSLRSTDGGPDVSEIAKKYGGGGHRNAAGFEMDLIGFVMGVYTGDKV